MNASDDQEGRCWHTIRDREAVRNLVPCGQSTVDQVKDHVDLWKIMESSVLDGTGCALV